ncbi:MAG: hypothetical protein D6785_12845 [Planctomycetota bacterium]|nr:MAG: hypothetical protein D6785_12845 [Planctomycetota bacterium]
MFQKIRDYGEKEPIQQRMRIILAEDPSRKRLNQRKTVMAIFFSFLVILFLFIICLVWIQSLLPSPTPQKRVHTLPISQEPDPYLDFQDLGKWKSSPQKQAMKP